MKCRRVGFRSSNVTGSAMLLSGALAQAQDARISVPHQHRPISVPRVHEDQTGVDSYNWRGDAV
jgi:hypothetical protein